LEQYQEGVKFAEALPERQIPTSYLAMARHNRDQLEQGDNLAACVRRSQIR
jgi:hypothetical protein